MAAEALASIQQSVQDRVRDQEVSAWLKNHKSPSFLRLPFHWVHIAVGASGNTWYITPESINYFENLHYKDLSSSQQQTAESTGWKLLKLYLEKWFIHLISQTDMKNPSTPFVSVTPNTSPAQQLVSNNSNLYY